MRKFIFRIFPKFSPFPKTFLGNSPIFPIPLRKKFFGEMEALFVCAITSYLRHYNLLLERRLAVRNNGERWQKIQT